MKECVSKVAAPEPIGGSADTSSDGPLPRSDFRLSRDTFSKVFALTHRQPWLKDKQNALADLMDDCDTQEQQMLICDLLGRFTFLDGNSFQEAIQKIADYIQDGLKIGPENCSISARDNSKFSDSSQMVAYQLKAAKWNSTKWNAASFVSSLQSLVDRDVSTSKKENIILVDEFIGTGESAIKSVRWLREKLAAKSLKRNIYFAVVAGMEDGIAKVGDVVNGVFSNHILKKGISGFYSPSDVVVNTERMKKLEELLSEVGRRGKLKTHSLGYEGSESLYSRANGNTPNNVFPVFWWEKKRNGLERSTILTCM